MTRRSIQGTCRICGTFGRLTFDHVPPRSAFNDQPILLASGEQVLGRDSLDAIGGSTQQRGAGGFSLCERCNNETGGWYGRAYAEWVAQGLHWLVYGDPQRPCLFRIYPLRVIKQVVCMFFSTSQERFREVHPELVRFVRDRSTKSIQPDIRIYAFYNPSNRHRQTGVAASFNFGLGGLTIMNEIAAVPVGYLMSIDSAPPDDRLFDISFFSGFGYDERRELSLVLPILPVYSPFPGDYRDRQQVIDEARRSLAEDA